MPITAPQPTTQALDPDVVALSKAIRDTETPGGQAIPGKTGELTSRYQFMPATWKSEAGRILGNPNAPLTNENENKVAYTRIKEWKDKGYGPDQIASMWNSGHPDWRGNVGVNKAGVNFDTPAYVAKVGTLYKQYKGQGQSQAQPVMPPIAPQTAPKGPGGILGALGSVYEGIGQAGLGAGKQVLSDIAWASSLGEKLIGAPASALGLKQQGPTLGERVQQSGALAPQGTAQKIGAGTARVAEMFAPTGAEEAGAALGGRLAEAAPRGLKTISGLLPRMATGAVEFGGKTALQGGTPSEVKGAAIGGALVPAALEAAKTPLTMAAERMYQSALKPTGELADRLAAVRTGLKERVFLSQGGVEAVAAKIDDLEKRLGDRITEAAGSGAKVSTAKMEQFVNEIRDAFKHNVDVEEAKRADKEVTGMLTAFKKRYGKEIPIEEAQKIKVASGQNLRKMYGQMTSSPRIEASKQMVRGLKEGILEKAPVVGDINKRLGALYQFDKALEKATGRVKNLNLLGLGAKLGAAAGGKVGAAAGTIADLLEHPFVKSGAAIKINDLAQLSGKGAPLGQVTLNEIIRAFNRKSGSQGQ